MTEQEQNQIIQGGMRFLSKVSTIIFALLASCGGLKNGGGDLTTVDSIPQTEISRPVELDSGSNDMDNVESNDTIPELPFDLGIDSGDICAPDCTGRDCGDDGCGGSCGECGPGDICNDELCEEGMCVLVPVPDGQECDIELS